MANSTAFSQSVRVCVSTPTSHFFHHAVARAYLLNRILASPFLDLSKGKLRFTKYEAVTSARQPLCFARLSRLYVLGFRTLTRWCLPFPPDIMYYSTDPEKSQAFFQNFFRYFFNERARAKSGISSHSRSIHHTIFQ